MQDNEASQSQVESLWKKEDLLIEKYSSKPSNLEVYEFQVSGKTPKYINNVNGTIYKQYSPSEHSFYEFLQNIPSADPRAALKAYVPAYFGVSEQQGLSELQQSPEKAQREQREGNRRSIWIDHIASRSKSEAQRNQKFILLKNMTFGYAIPNIIDLKLGIKKPKKSNIKFEKSTTNSHKFRINGMMVGLKEGNEYEECFISKYHGQKITLEQIQGYLSLFFFNGETIHKNLLEQVILQLDDLINAFRQFTGIHFISSSLFIAYDAENPKHFTVNLIDFDKYEHTHQEHSDDIISQGLSNIRGFFCSILDNRDAHLQRLLRRQLGVFKEEHQVVPEEKIKQYGQ